MLLARLQDVLNRNVAGSRRAQELTRRLDGRALELEVTNTPLKIFMEARDGRIVLAERRDTPADARLAGTPLALLALAGPEAEGRLRSGKVRIEGDAEIAQAFRDLLEQTRPDLEEELSQIVGDVAARRVANLAREVLAFGRRATDSLATSAAEYLQEEGRDVPARIEVEEFLRDVDQLRDDVERLEARITRLAPPRDNRTDTAAQLTCARVCSAVCSPYSACWSGTAWTTSSSRRTFSGPCGSCSICRPRPGSSALAAAAAVSGSGSRSRPWVPSSSSSARRCPRGATCYPPTSPTSSQSCRTAFRPSRAPRRG